MIPVLARRLVVVTGKGGVGRTTVTAALGRAAAAAGRTTCTIELSGQDALARAHGLPASRYVPQQVAPGLYTCALTPTGCLADFGRRRLGLSGLATWFFESRLMTGFIDAVPGLHDLLQLGKIENMLTDPRPGDVAFDLLVIDAPATGHGLTFLAAARSMREMTGVGPFHDLSRVVEHLLADPDRTGTALVTLPEPLPVHEGLELAAALAEEGSAPAAVLVNQVAPPWPDVVADAVVLDALDPAKAGAAHADARAVLREVARHEQLRAARQREATALLESGLAQVLPAPAPLVRLPLLDDPSDLAPLVAVLTATEGPP